MQFRMRFLIWFKRGLKSPRLAVPSRRSQTSLKDKVAWNFRHKPFWSAIQSVASGVINVFKIHKMMQQQIKTFASEEERMFGAEVERLKAKYPGFRACSIENANHLDVIAKIQAFNPYFLLVMGGPFYCQELLDTVRGVALNQHAGWSPRYRGSHTVEWALYHRDLAHVGATVHEMTTAVDSGDIFARSWPVLLGDESLEVCQLRTVALGNRMMIDVVEEIMQNQTLRCLKQGPVAGQTYLSRDFDPNMLKDLYRYFNQKGYQADLMRSKNV